MPTTTTITPLLDAEALHYATHTLVRAVASFCTAMQVDNEEQRRELRDGLERFFGVNRLVVKPGLMPFVLVASLEKITGASGATWVSVVNIPRCMALEAARNLARAGYTARTIGETLQGLTEEETAGIMRSLFRLAGSSHH